MLLNDLAVLAAETVEKAPPTIHPYIVGGGALGILLLLMAGLLAFGAGREHS
jgi:hypothetical protein